MIDANVGSFRRELQIILDSMLIYDPKEKRYFVSGGILAIKQLEDKIVEEYKDDIAYLLYGTHYQEDMEVIDNAHAERTKIDAKKLEKLMEEKE